MIPIVLLFFLLIGVLCSYHTFIDIFACVQLMRSNIPYESTDYRGDKQTLFQKRPLVYWSRKSIFRPFLVMSGENISREALSKCVTKSDDMFLIHHQNNGPVKFGQLVIPVLPDSILTNSKNNLRRELRSNLNQVNSEDLFDDILRFYEKQKRSDEGAHLFVAMVCVSIWIDLDSSELLEFSRKTVDCFKYFYEM